jgi:hypothetical protein
LACPAQRGAFTALGFGIEAGRGFERESMNHEVRQPFLFP